MRTFDRMKAAWAVEDKRRKALSFEDQIVLIKTDREAARTVGATRVRNEEMPSLMVFGIDSRKSR